MYELNVQSCVRRAGPVDTSFQALSRRLRFVVRRHEFSTLFVFAGTFDSRGLQGRCFECVNFIVCLN